MIQRMLIFLSLILAIDLYAYQVFANVVGPSSMLTTIYIAVSIIMISAFVLFLSNGLQKRIKIERQVAGTIVFMFFLPKFLLSIFMLMEDAVRLLKISANFTAQQILNFQDFHLGIERSELWSWVALVFTLFLMGAFVYGAIFNVYNYKIRKVPLRIVKLPKAFDGLKVVQISDIHSGSLSDKNAIQKAVHTINGLEPDLVFFTGDLVNNIATEILPFTEIFSGIRANHGVFSVLGNHDYGDYMYWENPEDKIQNLNHLKSIHQKMGWRLLLNEHVHIEKDGEKIIVAGVENWSASNRFPKHGKLQLALDGIHDAFTVLLLSHDPSHWEAEVLHHPAKIDIMFAGHTHGMQFGFEFFKIKWSPVKYFYKQWAGLYENSGRYLYVNRGFGVIGYPGRIGILPEITLFTLNA